MQKNKLKNQSVRGVAVFGTIKVMVVASLLAAMSIVCGKYLAIGVGNVLRFSLENLPILLSGIAFGPVVGAVTGAVADLVGCLLVGYAVNPLVTLGAVLVGATGGAVFSVLKKHTNCQHGICTGLCVAISHLLGSVLVKTVGLSAFYDMPFGALLLWRLLNYAIVGTLEFTVLYFLTKNRAFVSMIGRVKK